MGVRLSGKAGSVSLGTTPATVVGVTNWSLTYTGEALESTGMDSSGVKTYIPGLTGWSGSCSGHWDTAEAKFVGETPGIRPGAAAATASLLLSATGGNLYSGSAIITSFGVTAAVDGLVDFTIEFQGTGALTEPTA